MSVRHRVMILCMCVGLGFPVLTDKAQEPAQPCPPDKSELGLTIAFSFQTLTKPDIPQEDIQYLSNELVKAACEILCQGGACTLKARTTSVSGFSETPFYVTKIDIPNQTEDTVTILKAKCKEVVTKYNKGHELRLVWSLDIGRQKEELAK